MFGVGSPLQLVRKFLTAQISLVAGPAQHSTPLDVWQSRYVAGPNRQDKLFPVDVLHRS